MIFFKCSIQILFILITEFLAPLSVLFKGRDPGAGLVFAGLGTHSDI